MHRSFPGGHRRGVLRGMASMYVRLAGILASGLLFVAPPVFALDEVTREGAVRAVLEHGARVAVARAQADAGAAGLTIARALQNPTVSGGYSKSPPQYHGEVEFLFDYP